LILRKVKIKSTKNSKIFLKFQFTKCFTF